jgi:restriction endonuclease S subunit
MTETKTIAETNRFIPIPPLHVQKEIVRILDAFTELTNRKKQYNHYRDQLLSFEDGEGTTKNTKATKGRQVE